MREQLGRLLEAGEQPSELKAFTAQVNNGRFDLT
jgi:hypothetical protein